MRVQRKALATARELVDLEDDRGSENAKAEMQWAIAWLTRDVNRRGSQHLCSEVIAWEVIILKAVLDNIDRTKTSWKVVADQPPREKCMLHKKSVEM